METNSFHLMKTASETQIRSPIKILIHRVPRSLTKNWSPHRITKCTTCRTYLFLGHWKSLEIKVLSGQMKLLSCSKINTLLPISKADDELLHTWHGQNFLGSVRIWQTAIIDMIDGAWIPDVQPERSHNRIYQRNFLCTSQLNRFW